MKYLFIELLKMEKYKLDYYMKNRTAIMDSWWPIASSLLISGAYSKDWLKENRLTSFIRRTIPLFGGFFISAFSLDIPFLHYFNIWNIEERFSTYQMFITPQNKHLVMDVIMTLDDFNPQKNNVSMQRRNDW